MNLKRVNNLPPDFPAAKQTLYRWHHEGRFPKLFKKFGGALCLDLDALDEALKNDSMSFTKKGVSK